MIEYKVAYDPEATNMGPSDYVKAAILTECDERKAIERLSGGRQHYPRICAALEDGADSAKINQTTQLQNTRLLHAILGLTTETGELATVLKKLVYYGKQYSDQDLKRAFTDELGDLLWYVALACDTLGLDLSEVMAANIRKLQARFPDRFSEHAAADENRDREAERRALQEVPTETPYQGGKPQNFCGTSELIDTMNLHKHVKGQVDAMSESDRTLYLGSIRVKPREQRTRVEVVALRVNSAVGCCEGFHSQGRCDCLEVACDPDSAQHDDRVRGPDGNRSGQ
jgi:NTP pyrophosphatase (non-canonical NTP hydrolase)